MRPNFYLDEWTIFCLLHGSARFIDVFSYAVAFQARSRHQAEVFDVSNYGARKSPVIGFNASSHGVRKSSVIGRRYVSQSHVSVCISWSESWASWKWWVSEAVIFTTRPLIQAPLSLRTTFARVGFTTPPPHLILILAPTRDSEETRTVIDSP